MTGRRVFLLAALLPPLLLGACRSNPAADTLEQQLVFTATGAYDAQSDRRERIAGGLRTVVWTTRPPLNAAALTVTYDGDSRAQAWDMRVAGPRFTARAAAGPGARPIRTPLGPGWRPARVSALKDVLVLERPDGLRLVTRGFVAQRDPALLAAFSPP